MNRRSFLGLSLKSIVLATAVSTGLARTTLNIADNRSALIDLLERRIAAVKRDMEKAINNQLYSDVFSKGTIPEGMGGLIQESEYKWREYSASFIA